MHGWHAHSRRGAGADHVQGGHGPARRAVRAQGQPGGSPHFKPEAILPAGPKQVRVLMNTIRDGQQSNLSAEMASCHRIAVGKKVRARAPRSADARA